MRPSGASKSIRHGVGRIRGVKAYAAGPAAVDRDVGAGDLRRIVAAEEQRQRAHLIGDEFLGRLGFQGSTPRIDPLLGQVARLMVSGICFSTSGVQT